MFVAPIVTYWIGVNDSIVETGADGIRRDGGTELRLAASPADADMPALAPEGLGPVVESVDVGSPPLQRTPATVAPLASTQSLVARCQQVISPWTPWMALVWLSGVTFLSLWNVGGWFVARRLKFVGTMPAPTSLADRMSALADRLSVSVPVRLLVSSLTQVPIAIGWCRPIVLLPLACISGMSTGQLDAILAHELAHIRRYDYVVNLLQTVVETLLFFHPAVWWISRRIRAEREHCCDDMAVAVCGSRVEYAEALASLEQQRAAIGPAMAARDKRDYTVLARVRRILGVAADDGVRRTRVLGGVLSVLLLVVLYVGYVAVAAQPERESDETTATESAEVEDDIVKSSSGAEKLVERMRGMSMQARRPRSDGRPDPIEARRLEILARLRALGAKAVPTLAATLQDDDVQMRRNAALVLIELRGEWTGKRIVDTRAAVPALIKALTDRDADVRAWSAHALAELGPDAAEAVPALIKLLKDPSEGPRNTSAIALGGIGPRASKAIPALTKALEDESADLRSFAAAAIKRIRGEKPDSARRPEHLHWNVKGTDDVLFALDDIVRFDWERQVVELKREKAVDLMGLQGPHVARGREFQARDAAGVLYEGRVISPSSSIAYDGPTIIHPSFELSPPLFEIAAGYPGALRENDQRRFHPRLRTALEKAGKLAVISADEKPSPIVKKGTEWAGDRNRLMVRAEIFPETFRIGAEARAHVFFAPQRKEPLPQDARIEIHSTLTTDGGAFFCTTDHSMRDSETSATVFHRGVTVLRWQPWGPVYGAEQSEAKPGPGKIQFKVILRDADGKAIGEHKPAPLDVTILPRSNRLSVDQKIKALIGGVPAATRYEDIEIFEPTPGVAGEYRIRADVKRFPLPSGPTVTAPFGQLYYLPKKNVCYIQWDPGGASTLHYYGPIEGTPDDLLTGLTFDDESEDRINSTSTDSPPVPAKTSVGPADEDSASRATRGTVSGVVTDAATGKPVSGAYVAIDRSGDAGGSNLGRFREQGIYVTGEADTEGRYVLENVAFSDQHPFYVTCPDYVRHEQFVAVSNAKPAVHVDVRLEAGATIEVTAVDGDKRPLTGETWIRLESKAGPIFVPPREDWPRTTMRTEKVKDGRARFGELPAGEYSIDVMQIGPSDDELRSMIRDKTPEETKAALSTTARELTYHSSTKSVTVGAGESIVREMPPLGHKSEITINVAKDPYTVKNQAFVAFVISRDPGRLLWIGRQFFHPEDHRLGRILRDDMVRIILVPGQSCRLRNLPPGDYAAFAYSMGLYPNFKSPAIFARAVKLEIRNGVTKTVNIPWTDPEGPSFVGPRALMALDTLVQVQARSYSVAELCSVLTAATDSRAKFQTSPPSKDRSVALQAAELSIWQLLERLYLDQGWEVAAEKDTFTIAAPTGTTE